MSEQSIKQYSDKATDSNQSSPTTPFNAAELFAEKQTSVVRVSDKVKLGPNVLDNTIGSGFAIEKIETDGKQTSCRFGTDNHVVAHTTKDARLQLGNGNEYPFSIELSDEANDLAIVRVDGIKKEDCNPVELTDQVNPLVKDDVVVKLGARNGTPAFTEGKVETYFERDAARGLPLLPNEDPKRQMLSVTTTVNYSQGGDSGGPMFDTSGKAIAVMDAEGMHVMAGTPAHLLRKDLEKLHQQD